MKILALVLTLFLASCTDVTPQVNWLKNPVGPTLEKKSYSIAQGEDLIISGTSTFPGKNWRILVKLSAGSTWESVENIWDASYQNDNDLSDRTFKFKVAPSKFIFTSSEKTTSVLIKFVFNNEYETTPSAFPLTIQAIKVLRADALTPSGTTNQKVLNLAVTGMNISHYSYKIGDYAATDCLSSNGYISVPTLSLNIDLSLSSDGKKKLCLLGYDGFGNSQSQSDPTETFWTLDTTPPQIEIYNPPSQFTNATTYALLAIGSSNGDAPTAYKYIFTATPSDCLNDSLYSLESPLTLGLNLIASPSMYNEEVILCLRGRDQAGNWTSTENSYKLKWKIDVTPPSGTISNVAHSRSLVTSPYFNISASDSLSGVKNIFASVLSSSAFVLVGPELIPNNSSYRSTSYTYNRASNYILEIRITDAAGNEKVISSNFTSADCVTTNPNSVSYFGNVCEEIASATILGWKMQGGTIMARENSTSLLVVERSPFSVQTTGPLDWGGLDSGHYVDLDNWLEADLDPLNKNFVASPVNNRCRSMTKNSLSDWFVPNLTQISKIYCNRTATPVFGFPRLYPNCQGAVDADLSIVDMGALINIWTNSEKNSNEAYVFNLQTGQETVTPKNTQGDYICIRRFVR